MLKKKKSIWDTKRDKTCQILCKMSLEVAQGIFSKIQSHRMNKNLTLIFEYQELLKTILQYDAKMREINQQLNKVKVGSQKYCSQRFGERWDAVKNRAALHHSFQNEINMVIIFGKKMVIKPEMH